MANASHGRLRFHSAAAPAFAGRRLSASGGLLGDLQTLGYYSTQICFGTPPRPFDVIVDTGSAVTAVPCRSCTTCGPHRCGVSGRFDPAASSTAQRANCRESSARGLSCDRCTRGGGCGYRVDYMEGSSVRGAVVRDVVQLTSHGRGGVLGGGGGGDSTRRVSPRVHFGCGTFESGLFRSQRADGILGLQPAKGPQRARVLPSARGSSARHAGATPCRWPASCGRGTRDRGRRAAAAGGTRHESRVPSVLSSLMTQQGAYGAFSLCLAEHSGLLLLGGKPDAARIAAAGGLTARVDVRAEHAFALRLLDVKVTSRVSAPQAAAAAAQAGAAAPAAHGGYVSLGVGPRALNPAYVDSATTFLYAPRPLFDALSLALTKAVPGLRRVGAHTCAMLSQAELDAMPSLQLVFALAPRPKVAPGSRVGGLTIRPRQYMVAYPLPTPTSPLTTPISSSPAPASAGGGASLGATAAHRYCADIFSSGARGGTVLGASVLRGREVIFDLPAKEVSFVEADCERMAPEGSLLRGAFSFAPCANQTRV